MANPGKSIVLFGSDGSEMEGDNAEAARLAVAEQLNIKILIDDNNSTIAGRPQQYMPGYDLTRTLSGYGLSTETTMGEDLDALFVDLCRAFRDQQPRALVIKRIMAPGIEGAEGDPKSHDALGAEIASDICAREATTGTRSKCSSMHNSIKIHRSSVAPVGPGEIVTTWEARERNIDGMDLEQRVATVRVFDNDLEDPAACTTSAKSTRKFTSGGIMERGNYSAAAGFGSAAGRQEFMAPLPHSWK